MNEKTLEIIKGNSNLRVIFQVAARRLQRANAMLGAENDGQGNYVGGYTTEDIRVKIAHAEGMAMAAALIDDSPFDTTTGPVTFLWYVVDGNRAEELYV